MLIVSAKDKKWIRDKISKKYNFNKRFTKLRDKITSKQFKDGLQGIFWFIEDKTFEKHKKAILELAA